MGNGTPDSNSDTSRIEMTLLIKLIPEYDGSFGKLTAFIDNVSEAFKLAKDDQKGILMSFVKAALRGSAQSLVQTINFGDWDTLKRRLIETFGEKKSFSQLQLELQNTKQRKDESIAAFTQRIENKTQKLMSTLSFELNQNINASQQELIKRMGLAAFIHNSLPQYGQLLRIKGPATITEASRLASDEEIALKYQRLSVRELNNPNKRVHFTSKLPHCTFCNRSGHSIENCFKRNPNKKIVCYNCKKEGHTSKNCFKKTSSQTTQNSSNFPKNGQGTSLSSTRLKPQENSTEASVVEMHN